MEKPKKKVQDTIISDFTLLANELSSIDHVCFKESVTHAECNGIKMPSTGIDLHKAKGLFSVAFFNPEGVQGVVQTKETEFAGLRVQHLVSSDVEDLSEYVIVHIINL